MKRRSYLQSVFGSIVAFLMLKSSKAKKQIDIKEAYDFAFLIYMRENEIYESTPNTVIAIITNNYGYSLIKHIVNNKNEILKIIENLRESELDYLQKAEIIMFELYIEGGSFLYSQNGDEYIQFLYNPVIVNNKINFDKPLVRFIKERKQKY